MLRCIDDPTDVNDQKAWRELVGSVLWTAVPAHGDEASYLDAVRNGGMPIISEPLTLASGYEICGLMRNGASREAAAAKGVDVLFVNAIGMTYVDAAQHHLCPDTAINSKYFGCQAMPPKGQCRPCGRLVRIVRRHLHRVMHRQVVQRRRECAATCFIELTETCVVTQQPGASTAPWARTGFRGTVHREGRSRPALFPEVG